ncbi:MAG: flagellar hook-associated protein FlgK, partial [Oscillospiraceae bacterium]
MRPTFLGFETARKGLMASQKGLDVSGQNITNINTAGYTRQRVDYISVSSSSSGRISSGKGSLAGQGVAINGVSQIRDPFLDKRFREEYADVGMYDQNIQILKDLESILDEVTSSGLKDGIKNMLNSLNNFSKNPDQSSHANIFLTSAKSMTQVLSQFSNKVDAILDQQKFNAQIAVNDINSILERLSEINKSITRDISLTGGNNEYYGPNELLDKRNVLLDELSKYGDIKISNNSDGSVSVDMFGHNVIDGDKFDEVNFVRNIDNTISFTWQSSGDKVVATTGSLKSFTDLINGRGPNAIGDDQNFEKGILYYKDRLDIFAKEFVSMFNSSIDTKATNAIYKIPAPTVANVAPYTVTVDLGGAPHNINITGTTTQEQTTQLVRELNQNVTFSQNYTATIDNTGSVVVTAKNPGLDDMFGGIDGFNGLTGTDSFTVEVAGMVAGQIQKTLFEPFDITNVTAGNITVSGIWASDADYIMTDVNGDGALDNAYILALIDSFNKEIDFGDFKGNFEDYINSYNTNLGQQIEFNQTRFDATAAIADEMLNRRDAISGVSLDEEGTNLMTYDKAYKAISRLMTTLDEALDTLINRT